MSSSRKAKVISPARTGRKRVIPMAMHARNAAASLALLLPWTAIHAQTTSDGTVAQAPPPNGMMPALQPPPQSGNPMEKFERIDAILDRGLTTIFPGSYDSLTGDWLGWRSALADHNIAVEIHNVTSLMYNPFDTGQPRSPQLYNGQRFTVQTQSTSLNLVAGLNAIGLPNSKIIIGGVTFTNSAHEINGTPTVGFRTLAYYQSFFNKAVELKLGWTTNYEEYVGLFTGGSPVLSSGITGLIPIETGLSADPTPTPAVNLTLHGPTGLYAKFGVQRSVSPRGLNDEIENNGVGLRFSLPGAGPLYISEFGVRRVATPGGHQIWLRAGAMYNDSDYERFSGGTASNRSAYVAGDYQLTQPSEALSYRGIYVGASGFWAPSNVNVYTQTYTVRAYGIGLFDSRPADTMSVSFTYNQFSREAGQAYQQLGLYTNPNQYSVQLAYSMHVARGIYLIPGATYYKHPSFTGNFKDALVLSTTLYFQL